MAESNFSTFPPNRIEALTMLYLENQDLSMLSPEDLVVKYREVYEQVKKHLVETTPKSKAKGWSY